MAAPGVHDAVVAQLPPSPCRILDLGSGEGALAARLARLGYEVVACDIRRPATKEGFSALTLNLDNELPFKPGVFDVVLLIEVVEHLERPGTVVRNALRALRPGGFIIVTTPNIQNFLARAHFLRSGYYGRWFQKNDLEGSRLTPGFDHISPIHPTTLGRIISGAGAQVVTITTNRELRIRQMNSVFSLIGKLVEVFGLAFMTPRDPALLFGDIIVVKAVKGQDVIHLRAVSEIQIRSVNQS
jgi:SAM-dependent methyltransferase